MNLLKYFKEYKNNNIKNNRKGDNSAKIIINQIIKILQMINKIFKSIKKLKINPEKAIKKYSLVIKISI